MKSLSFQPILNLTSLILTVPALQRMIRPAIKPLRMLRIHNLPFNQHDQRSKEQTPAQEIRDKKHGREHHKMSPVINPAVDTAPILHDECLEGAEQQDANVIAEEIKYRQHKKIHGRDHFKQIQ